MAATELNNHQMVSVRDPLQACLDPKLPTIREAIDPVTAQARLNAVCGRSLAACSPLRLNAIRVTRHKPGRRCVVEYDVAFRRGEHGTPVRITLLGKIRARGVNVENYALLESLSRGDFSACAADGISIPEPLGIDTELGMWLQAKVEGESAAESLCGVHGPEVAWRLADAICKLHRSRQPLRRVHTWKDELRILSQALAKASELCPPWSQRIDAVARHCSVLAASLDGSPTTCIHRDFYHDQALVSGDRVWLVDLDLMCAGDPAVDAGNFIGHLIEWGVRQPPHRRRLEEAALRFKERFLSHAGADRSRAVDAYTTLTLARHIYLSTQFQDRAPFTEAILSLCEAKLAVDAPRQPVSNCLKNI